MRNFSHIILLINITQTLTFDSSFNLENAGNKLALISLSFSHLSNTITNGRLSRIEICLRLVIKSEILSHLCCNLVLFDELLKFEDRSIAQYILEYVLTVCVFDTINNSNIIF